MIKVFSVDQTCDPNCSINPSVSDKGSTVDADTLNITNSISQSPITQLKKLRGFRIGHLNVVSLTKYIDQLRIYMYDKPLDILTLNETRLDDNISDKYIEISGYEIVRKDRNRIGGGVAIYYRDHLNVRNRDELVPEGVEAVCVEVLKTKCAPLLISTIYRPPSSKVDIFEKIENLVQNLDNENKEIILAGDVNCDLLANVHSNHTNRLLTIANLFQLTQIIDEPTRVTEYTSTLVDWLMTNKPENISNTGVLHLGVSDHSLIYGCRKIAFSRKSIKIGGI